MATARPLPLGSRAPTTPSPQDQLQVMIREAAAKYRVPEALLAALVQVESSGNPNARSPKGAMGLTQLMPATAQALGVQNPMDPAENLDAGARHLSNLLTKYRGNMSLALAAYNAGEPAVDRVQGIPNNPETVAYVQKIADIVNRAGGAQAPAQQVSQAPSPPGQTTPFRNPMTRPGPAAPPTPQAPPGQRTPPGYPTPYPNPMTRPSQGPTPSRPIDRMDVGPFPPLKADRRLPELPEGAPGTASGLSGMSNQQLDSLVQAYGGVPEQQGGQGGNVAPYDPGLYTPPTETRETAGRGSMTGGGMPAVPDYAVPNQGYDQPSVAPFFSGGTMQPQQVPGLGGLSRLFKPSGGRTFGNDVPSER